MTVPQLMVSVRSAEEADAALLAGIVWLDVKEPRHGSLGSASPQTWRQIADRIAAEPQTFTPMLSIALGEFADRPPEMEEIPPRADFLKIGLAGCDGRDQWASELSEWWSRVPGHFHRVAVHYADRRRAKSPPLTEVLHFAHRAKCRAVLLDTYDKRTGPLTQSLTQEEIGRFVDEVHDLGMLAVVGGSIRETDLADVAVLGPDVIAVRGAVCGNDRNGPLVSEKVVSCLRQLHVTPPIV